MYWPYLDDRAGKKSGGVFGVRRMGGKLVFLNGGGEVKLLGGSDGGFL